MRRIFLLIFSVIATGNCIGQASVKDSVLRFPMLSLSYAYQVPGGTIAKRFGPNSNIGASLIYKNRKNWMAGFEGTFIFSENIKETGIFDKIAIRTDIPGTIVDATGVPGEIHIFERGYTVNAIIGKIIPFKKGPNPNSGLMILVKGGFIEHKIRIEDIAHSVYPLTDEYKIGYDRLTQGWNISEFIGYQYFSNQRLVNFFIGFEFLQALTKSQRFDFDLMRKDNSTHHDFLNSIRVGWTLPLYKKAPKEFYYY